MPEPESSWSQAVVLRDGTSVTIRPIRPDDAPRLQALVGRLSPQSVFQRFLGCNKALTDEEAAHLATVDYEARMALVATSGDNDECILGVARYESPAGAPGQAEFAVVVEDRYQGLGLGKALLRHLVAYARAHGLHTFVGAVRIENVRLLRFLERCGLEVQIVGCDQGIVDIRIELREPLFR